MGWQNTCSIMTTLGWSQNFFCSCKYLKFAAAAQNHPSQTLSVTLISHPLHKQATTEKCSQKKRRAIEMNPYHQMANHTVSGEHWDCLSGAQSISSSLGTLQQHVTQ